LIFQFFDYELTKVVVIAQGLLSFDITNKTFTLMTLILIVSTLDFED